MTPPAPHPRLWPSEVRRLIAERLCKRALAVWGANDEGRALGWQRLLVSTYAGTRRGGVTLPWQLSVDDAYQCALEDLAKEATP